MDFRAAEAHAHLMLNGINYTSAVKDHSEGFCEDAVRSHFEAYRKRDVTFIRDGGDRFGVSLRAKGISGEYNIDYRTPVFAIHKQDKYGSIVGRAYRSKREFALLVKEAKAQGADFIKIMASGIMDFTEYGLLTDGPLSYGEMKEFVNISRGEGLAVMAHVNGAKTVLDAVRAGIASIEHGYYQSSESIAALAESETVWVATFTPVKNLIAKGFFPDRILEQILADHRNHVLQAARAGAHLAIGSDAGAAEVPHGQGTEDEAGIFDELIKEEGLVADCLEKGITRIIHTFKR